jgi:hypothetical protein
VVLMLDVPYYAALDEPPHEAVFPLPSIHGSLSRMVVHEIVPCCRQCRNRGAVYMPAGAWGYSYVLSIQRI